ncbi:hypothetical protein TMatcc_008497 [Talaromyces marneffei ATCC 18224]
MSDLVTPPFPLSTALWKTGRKRVWILESRALPYNRLLHALLPLGFCEVAARNVNAGNRIRV